MSDSAAPPKSFLGILTSLQTPGFRLIDAGELKTFLSMLYAVHHGVVPAGTTAATATQLQSGISVIPTTTAGAGVKLPPASLPGQQVTVVASAATLVYGSGTDQIVPSDAAITAPSASVTVGPEAAVFTCIQASNPDAVPPVIGLWKEMIAAVPVVGP